MITLSALISLVAVIASCGWYLLVARKDAMELRSAWDFFLYQRNMGPLKIFGTFYASGMSLATVFIAFLQLAPILGIALIWSVVFYALGHVLLYFVAPRIRSFVGRGKTLHGFLFARYESATVRYIACIATIIGFVGVFATEMIIGTRLLEGLVQSAEGYWTALVFLSVVVVAYGVLGGFRSVVRTDVIQGFLILATCFILAGLGLSYGRNPDGVLIPAELTTNWMLPSLLLLNFFLINVPFPLVDMSAWQRVVASRDTKSLSSGLGVAALSFAVTWGVILFAGLALAEYALEDSAGGLPSLLLRLGETGVVGLLIMAFAVAALVAAMLSTADTFLIAAGQAISMDITDRTFFETVPESTGEAEEESSHAMPSEHRSVVSRARMRMLLIAGGGLLAAVGLNLLGFQVAELVFAVYGSALALVPAVAVGLAAGSHRTLRHLAPAAAWSILAGIIFGWSYGILAVLSNTREGIYSVMASGINPFPGDPSVYNSPTAVFGTATVVFIVVGGVMPLTSLVTRFRKGEKNA